VNAAVGDEVLLAVAVRAALTDPVASLRYE
jgi:hypothetical protein